VLDIHAGRAEKSAHCFLPPLTFSFALIFSFSLQTIPRSAERTRHPYADSVGRRRRSKSRKERRGVIPGPTNERPSGTTDQDSSSTFLYGHQCCSPVILCTALSLYTYNTCPSLCRWDHVTGRDGLIRRWRLRCLVLLPRLQRDTRPTRNSRKKWRATGGFFIYLISILSMSSSSSALYLRIHSTLPSHHVVEPQPGAGAYEECR
jgi:hypothetical protein